MRGRFVLGMVAAFLLVATGCTQEPTPGGGDGVTNQPPGEVTGTIRLLSYSDGFDPKYIESFHTQYPNIDLKTSAMGSNEEAVAKIQAGFEVDVVNSCVDEATLEMVQKGMYMPLDVARLEHWEDLFPSMRELPGVQVDGQVYMLPVDAGTAGIVYDAGVVAPPPDSWTDLFDPRWEGHAAMEDISITAVMIGALATGVEDPLGMDQAQIDQVKDYLIEHRDQFRTFWKGDASIKALFKSGEVVIASGYPDTAKSLRKEGLNVEFAVAREGQFLWACGYGISPDIDPENLDAAYALLNWYTSPEAELYEAAEWKVLDIAPPDVIEAASLDAPFHLENAIPAAPPENRSAWVDAWTEVKAS